MYNLVLVSDKRALISSATTEIPPPPAARQKPTSDPKQSMPSTTSTNQPSTRDGIMSSSTGVAMETESSGEGPKVVGSKESRTVFVSNLIMATTEEQLRDKFSEVNVYVHLYVCVYMYICVCNFCT